MMLLSDALINPKRVQSSINKIAMILSLTCCLDRRTLSDIKSVNVSAICGSIKLLIQCRNECLSLRDNPFGARLSKETKNLRDMIGTPVVSNLILSWISYNINDNNLYIKQSFFDLLPVFLQLIQEISMQHALQRAECFEILKSIFDSCKRGHDDKYVLRAKCDTSDCMVDVMATGYTILPMKFFLEIISDQESLVVKYIIESILNSIQPPTSKNFRVCLQTLLAMDASKKVKFDDHLTKKILIFMSDDDVTPQVGR